MCFLGDLKDLSNQGERVDPCAKYGKRVVENLVICTKCDKWVHGRCTKNKSVTTIMTKSFVGQECVKTIEPDKEISYLTRSSL